MSSKSPYIASSGWLISLTAFAVLYPLVGEGIPDLDLGSIRIYWEAFIIPLSLRFGLGGILGVAIGVLVQNLYLLFSGQENPTAVFLVLQFGAFLGSLSLAYYIINRRPLLEGYVMGTAASPRH